MKSNSVESSAVFEIAISCIDSHKKFGWLLYYTEEVNFEAVSTNNKLTN